MIFKAFSQTGRDKFLFVVLVMALCLFIHHQTRSSDTIREDALSVAVPSEYMCSRLHCDLEPTLSESYLHHTCADERVKSVYISKDAEASAIKFCATEQCKADKALLASFSGAWCPAKLDKYFLDEGLANAVVSIVQRSGYNSLYDFGAGVGRYVNVYRANNIDALGFDGNLGVEEYTNGTVINRDFTSNELLAELKPREVVTCIETGEHVPKSKEGSLLDIISGLSSRLVIMSWARPGQGGVGHINLQPLEYIIAQMEERGCVHDKALSEELNNSATLSWFKKFRSLFACKK